MHNINTDIAFTYLRTGKKMTMIAMLGVLLGMSLYIFMNSMLVGFDRVSNNTIFKNSPHIRIFKDDIISQPLHPDHQMIDMIVNPQIVPSGDGISNPDEIIEIIKKEDFVTAVSPQITTTVFYNIGKLQVPGTVTGIRPEEADKMFDIKSNIIEGNYDHLQNNVNAIAIGKGIAKNLSLGIDDNINITSSKGISRNLKVVAIFKTNNSVLDKTKSYINITAAQQLLSQSNSYITDINVSVSNPEDATAKSRTLSTLTGYASESWLEANESIMAAFRMRRLVITFVSLTILIVAGFGIYNILNMTVTQKINDIAILKAIGFKGRDVVRIFLSQAMAIGFMGMTGGIMLAALFIFLLQRVYIGGDIGYFPIGYELSKFLQGILVGGIITFFAGYLPARKAAHVDPISIFRK
ncbi:MAG TPA: ABC transporter permease [Saprospiraceae bacterium]|nr:ABC transporter permease [Saprospiraceae bacterium]HRO07400.1 ABC transporter permease [Saprospiraceae bacterium]HRP40683.1 ABC transporter permease [Saprospiraceae bacterium]